MEISDFYFKYLIRAILFHSKEARPQERSVCVRIPGDKFVHTWDRYGLDAQR